MSTHEERIALAKALCWDSTDITPDDVKGIIERLNVAGFTISRFPSKSGPLLRPEHDHYDGHDAIEAPSVFGNDPQEPIASADVIDGNATSAPGGGDCIEILRPDVTSKVAFPRNAHADPILLAARDKFSVYFARNYPGPDTTIFNPYWHAPKLFAAVVRAISEAAQAEGQS